MVDKLQEAIEHLNKAKAAVRAATAAAWDNDQVSPQIAHQVTGFHGQVEGVRNMIDQLVKQIAPKPPGPVGPPMPTGVRPVG